MAAHWITQADIDDAMRLARLNNPKGKLTWTIRVYQDGVAFFYIWLDSKLVDASRIGF